MNHPLSGSPLRQVCVHLGLAVAAAVVLLPFGIMLRTAVTPERYVFEGILSFPELTAGNIARAWREAPWLHYYWNSLLVVTAVYLGQVATCLPAGYALARLRFRGNAAVTWLVVACLAIPAQVIAVPVFLLFSRIGWLDTLQALVVPFLGSAFGVFLFRQFILTIPQSLFDAARLDGVGPFAIVWHVVVPNVRPALAAFGVFSVVSHWNDLFWPSVVLRSDSAATVPFGIAAFAAGEASFQYGAQMAAATIAAVPLIIAFVFVQRQFMEGIAPSATTD